ncbi:hypothetical protein CEXT_267271 [Caerostris extrusa]|uniref:Uncharacterized protein n=1 Tax=Caerostris extrusa TaxID=172846 RepID=A0AAV4RV42_CAEEX|nr:hypothetical protein CEXT_267271 [Caerostris extrusa]
MEDLAFLEVILARRHTRASKFQILKFSRSSRTRKRLAGAIANVSRKFSSLAVCICISDASWEVFAPKEKNIKGKIFIEES